MPPQVISIISLILLTISCCCSGLTIPSSSIVTGANGFVGRHIVHSLIQQRQSEDVIICLVRDSKVECEQSYWDAHLSDLKESEQCLVKVLPYDMLDDGGTLKSALQAASTSSPSSKICVYHTASVFGPTEDPVQTANDNVKSAEIVVEAMQDFIRISSSAVATRLVLTSSMAAVRATNQTPLNNKYYTNKDWNTLSKLDPNNWGSCYQYSKAESERRAMEMVAKCPNQLEFIALCPSFVFGPPPPLPRQFKSQTAEIAGENSSGSSSFSISLIKQWLNGASQVQSRLCVDVRDVAKAHIAAGQMDLGDSNDPRRYILSTEARLSSELTADALKRAVEQSGSSTQIDTSKISCDTEFDGGAIKIGDQEVECNDILRDDLGVTCRSVDETFYDMVVAMLAGENF